MHIAKVLLKNSTYSATATLMDEYEVFLSFLVFQGKQNSLKEKRVSAAPAFRMFAHTLLITPVKADNTDPIGLNKSNGE